MSQDGKPEKAISPVCYFTMRKEQDNNAKHIAVGLASVLGLLLVTLLFIFAAVYLLRSLDSGLAAALTAASATILTSVLAVILSKRYEQKVRVSKEIRDQKIPVYEEMISTFFRFVFAEKTGRQKPSDREIMRAIADVTPKLIIWASEDVIRVWNSIRYHDWSGTQSDRSLALWNELLTAIRKDVGNSVNQLDSFDLLRLFINDLEVESNAQPKAHPSEA